MLIDMAFVDCGYKLGRGCYCITMIQLTTVGVLTKKEIFNIIQN